MYHLKSDSFLLLCIIYESGSSLCQLKSLRENDSPQIYCVGEVEKSRARQPQKMQATFAGWVWVCFYVTDLMVRAHFGQSNFSFFQQKRKQEILLIVVIFTYFKVQTKIEKKKMVRQIDHFFIFLILKSASKIQKIL